MKSPALVLCLLSLAAPASACGPWFPDTVLDDPQSALRVPPVCYLEELALLFPGRAPSPEAAAPANDAEVADAIEAEAGSPLLRQIPRERAELLGWWKAQGLDPAEIERRSRAYTDLRRRQLSSVDSVGMHQFTFAAPAADLPERPLADLLPPDVADFVEASRLLSLGQVPEARTLWQAILDRPAAEKQFRAAGAAWMLAKTSKTWEEAKPWYQRVREEVAAGAKDCLGLAPDAAGWLGPREENPAVALRLLAEAWRDGSDQAIIDLRILSNKLLFNADPDQLAIAARDPLARQILILESFAILDGDEWTSSPLAGEREFPFTAWLTALEEHGPAQPEGADRIAWGLYSTGRFDQARDWLARANPSTPRALWLKAKFALMEGRIDQADRAFERALTLAKRQSVWKPANPDLAETSWLDSERGRAVESYLLGDAAIIDLSRGEYSRALERLAEADNWTDAAYIAERVLTTDELLDHVRRHAPAWSQKLARYWAGQLDDIPKPEDITPTTKGVPEIWNLTRESTSGDDLRYLLGRRLTREFRFREAREFMPRPMLPLYDHFVALHRAGISTRYAAEQKTAILWHEAALLREFGLLLIGTEGAPDAFERWGDFEAYDFLPMRARRLGWRTAYQYESESDTPPTLTEKLDPHRVAIPRVREEEIRRARAHSSTPMKRFHYRYRAAELAWKAAELAPDNSNTKVHILNSAGKWLAARDPIAADRFYKALVRRNWSHPLGQAADQKRWFISMEIPPDLPKLPTELQPR